MSDDAALCCERCHEPLRGARYYREVVGWERPRAQGGANQITLRRTTGRVRCADCVELERIGFQLELPL